MSSIIHNECLKFSILAVRFDFDNFTSPFAIEFEAFRNDRSRTADFTANSAIVNRNRFQRRNCELINGKYIVWKYFDNLIYIGHMEFDETNRRRRPTAMTTTTTTMYTICSKNRMNLFCFRWLFVVIPIGTLHIFFWLLLLNNYRL